MVKATLSSKGQITIPKEIRDFLQVDTSDTLDFSILDAQSKTVQIKKANETVTCPLCSGAGIFKTDSLPCFLCDQMGEVETRTSLIEMLFRSNLRKYKIGITTIGQDCGVPQIIINSSEYPRELLNKIQDLLIIKLIEEHAPRSLSDPTKFMIPSDVILNDYLNLLTTDLGKEVVECWFRGERTI